MLSVKGFSIERNFIPYKLAARQRDVFAYKVEQMIAAGKLFKLETVL